MRTIPPVFRVKPETSNIHDAAASGYTSATWKLTTASGGLLRKRLSKTVLFPPWPSELSIASLTLNYTSKALFL